MFSPQQAAKKANVSRKTIMNNIQSGKLKAHRNNENHWSIRPTDLENWLRERNKNAITPPTDTPTYPPTEISPDTSHGSHGVSLTPDEYKKFIADSAELEAMTKLLILKDEEIKNLKSKVETKDAQIIEIIQKSYEGIQDALKEQRKELMLERNEERKQMALERNEERKEILALLKEVLKPEPLILTSDMRIK